jgi:hypothetical protein
MEQAGFWAAEAAKAMTLPSSVLGADAELSLSLAGEGPARLSLCRGVMYG